MNLSLYALQEHDEHAAESFWTEVLSVLTDPGHLFAELVFVLVIDVLLLGLLVPVVRRRWRAREERLHRLLDAEHGVSHGEDGSVRGLSPEVVQLALALDHLGVRPADLVRALEGTGLPDPPDRP